MATGHILPGYGNPVSRFTRARSALPMDKTKLREIAEQNVPPMSPRDLDLIRQNARRMWSDVDRQRTTYRFHHSGKGLDEPTKPKVTETERRNKPHPPLVFLTNRLHHIEGYQNPDTTVGREAYQVDGSLHPEEQQRRARKREKYIGRPHTAAINQYYDKYGLRDQLDPPDAQAAEAWIKIADEKDHHKVFQALMESKNEPQPEHFAMTTDRPRTAHPALNRWMKLAGANESANLQRILENIRTNPDRMPNIMRPSGSAGSCGDRRRSDVDAVGYYRYYKPLRGEFLLHPDWPPTIPHHRVP